MRFISLHQQWVAKHGNPIVWKNSCLLLMVMMFILFGISFIDTGVVVKLLRFFVVSFIAIMATGAALVVALAYHEEKAKTPVE